MVQTEGGEVLVVAPAVVLYAPEAVSFPALAGSAAVALHVALHAAAAVFPPLAASVAVELAGTLLGAAFSPVVVAAAVVLCCIAVAVAAALICCGT